jgi:hypothetical protein
MGVKENNESSEYQKLLTDTISEIAKTTGYDLTMVTRWFSPNVSKGNRRSPLTTTCKKIGAAYGLEAWEVMKIIEERLGG